MKARIMMEEVNSYIEVVAKAIEIIGIFIILGGIFFAIFNFILAKAADRYKSLKQNIGKAILLGLEVLVAADIIATIVTEPTLESVLTLGVVVLIRTFLSLSIQVELEGKFPWQKKE